MHSRNSEKDSDEITVRVLKYDGSEHRRWTSHLVRREETLLQLIGTFDAEVDHLLLGKISKGTISVEYFWLDRWYSIFRFAEPTGQLRNYYCNVNLPPTFDESVLSFVDLDIDILVAPDFTYSILDEDEFAANISRFAYSSDVQDRVQAAISELISLIEDRQFPFVEID